MAELTLKLVVDPKTGKRSVVADYRSDADALPMEHEDTHRRLVQALVEQRLGELPVDRNAEARPDTVPGEEAAARDGLKQEG